MRAIFETRDETLFIGPMTSYTFPLHMHESIELAFVLSGGCVMQIAGQTHRLKPGDVALIFPFVPHSFDRIDEGTTGLAAIFQPGVIAEYAGTFRSLLPDDPVIRAEHLPGEARALADRLLAIPSEEPSPFRLAFLHLLLAHLLCVASFHPADVHRQEHSLTARAIRYIYEHACEDISLISAAHDLGISRSHLSHLCSAQFHINFRQLINAIRIDKAIQQMRDPALSLTQISDNCGYENMRTFRRAFIQQTGMTPSDYKRSIRRGA